ncbi:MAG: PAS domain S-box protein [Proteobacteria bacterium]|nr:PAS domain S-box protein [Pseudomonadota bacterium]
MFVGTLVLFGWEFDIGLLKSILPIWVSMKANTAVCFVLSGIALLLTSCPSATLNPQRPKLLVLMARFFSLLIGLIGLLSLSEYVFGWEFGIDQWLFKEPAGVVGTSYPGRMAPETAFYFVSLSVALLFLGLGKTVRTVLVPVIIGLMMSVFALAEILSYATPNIGVYGWFGLNMMAMPTAILFTILGIALIALSWQHDVLPWAFGRRTTVAIACGLVLLVFIGLSTNRSHFWLQEVDRQILQIEKMQGGSDRILVEVLDAKSHMHNYITTGDEQFLKAYLLAKADCSTQLDVLRRIEIAKPVHQSHFARIDTEVRTQFQWFEHVIDASRSGVSDATRNTMISQGDKLLDALRITFYLVENEHNQFIDKLKHESESVSQTSYMIIFSGTLIGLLIFMIVIFNLNIAVNERKQRERALKESVEKFRKITESAQDAIIMMGADQRISLWNGAAERMFGYTIAEAMGQELHGMIVPASAHARFSHAFPHFQQSGEGALIGKVTEVTASRKGGEEFPVELSVAAVQLQGQWHAISIVRDITERKQAEHKVEEQLDYLERFQKVAVKREFRIKELTDELINLSAEIEALKRRI